MIENNESMIDINQSMIITYQSIIENNKSMIDINQSIIKNN